MKQKQIEVEPESKLEIAMEEMMDSALEKRLRERCQECPDLVRALSALAERPELARHV